MAVLGVAAWTAAGFAQPAKMRRVGVLMPRARPASLDTGITGAFLRGMRELGYEEGRNVRYEVRFTEGKTEDLADQAAGLLAAKVDVIVAGGTPTTRAAQRATKDVPIVMVYTGDPVGSGFVASLARPGGNITGITNINIDMNAKRVDLLRAAFPKLKRVGALLNPANPTYPANLSSLREAAAKSGVVLSLASARRSEEIESALSMLKSAGADAVVVHTDSLFATQSRRIAELALQHRMPLLGGSVEIVDAGGLMSYSPSVEWAYQRAAFYVDRILKGTKPADMPVEQPAKLELVINVRTATALGISLPSEVTFRADKLIQ